VLVQNTLGHDLVTEHHVSDSKSSTWQPRRSSAAIWRLLSNQIHSWE